VSDVVVTVPKARWAEWLGEGALAWGHGVPWFTPLDRAGLEYGFVVGGRPPKIERGERVYIVAHGLLRGYAPLQSIGAGERFGGPSGSHALIRRGGAVAVTLQSHDGLRIPVRGFQGFRYRWWDRDLEVAFPGWRIEGV
jgi:hypothetical protein